MREEEWVDALARRFPFSQGIGIGDDAAVVSSAPHGRKWVVTSDLLVEGVHFRRQDLSARQLAIKSLAVNLSDLAAMGASPLFYTVALVLPSDFMAEKLEQFYDGLEEANGRWGVELAGGDLSSGSALTIAITAVGEAERPILRQGAHEGDFVAVCGRLGWSKLGLQQLLSGLRQSPYIDSHIKVEPLLEEGVVLSRYASAMMDVSDGLLKDLKRLCRASSVGAELDADALEPDSDFSQTCGTLGLSPLDTVLCGGEDYALLFTAGQEAFSAIMASPLKGRVTRIGRIVPRDEGVLVLRAGVELVMSCDGFDHFALRTD